MRKFNTQKWVIITLIILFILPLFLSSSQSIHLNDELTPKLVADHFDYPVGPPDAEGYYNAQGFGKNNHLGDDWNANSGGNTDLGDPIYSIGNGVVSFAQDINGGWGNVIRIIHQLPNGDKVESVYAHCDKIEVKEGQQVKKGDKIGTIGDAHGKYYAHLHLEIRNEINKPIGAGYSTNTKGYLDPTNFIKNHR
ncbi:M23 family metallopeptidase [Paracrocinitomix mangrovi]|uniref:M23 family metallopeptidase n=1 Tax=Paracrocinitomix mangrovi TaxID=2862509 RepID=UPI001C8DE06F|nr:M23 family metallopeptidase [Paracrocinitomix mangrovi]UKN00772.1 M23 family metallopeptidase [Paracrocinitomix mangrovi]